MAEGNFSPFGHPKGVTDDGTWTAPAAATDAADIGVADVGLNYIGTDVEDCLAEVGVLRIRKASLAIGHADLTEADNSQLVPFAAALPAQSRILSVSVKLTTPFTGGTVSACTFDVGTTGDADALIDGADVFAAAVDGYASTAPAGIAPNKHFVTAPTLNVTVANAGDTLANLSAGAATVEVLYVVLA